MHRFAIGVLLFTVVLNAGELLLDPRGQVESFKRYTPQATYSAMGTMISEKGFPFYFHLRERYGDLLITMPDATTIDLTTYCRLTLDCDAIVTPYEKRISTACEDALAAHTDAAFEYWPKIRFRTSLTPVGVKQPVHFIHGEGDGSTGACRTQLGESVIFLQGDRAGYMAPVSCVEAIPVCADPSRAALP